jgi:hypothetical protein
MQWETSAPGGSVRLEGARGDPAVRGVSDRVDRGESVVRPYSSARHAARCRNSDVRALRRPVL